MKKQLTLAIALITSGLLVLPVMAAATGNLLKSYETVSVALANDDLEAAKAAAGDLVQNAKTEENATLAEHADELAKSDSLDAAREHLKAMSNEAEKLAKDSDQYHVMTCPMAEATWVQSGEKVMNPYMGKKMQQCGSMMEGTEGADAGGMKCCPMMG